ncbi:BppU family phage baseplate upper protein [Enterococcus sp. HY326]|uniref:BppU family phage baseplate upper protein n=1 Tax=Enterococcus sp. HY326 TaxID=2971265 RepID=UPI00223F58D5|nr:BppU family phage baseplate upper protein [Enterococcus sp. HY326]
MALVHPLTLSTEHFNLVGDLKLRQADDNGHVFAIKVIGEDDQVKTFDGLTPFFCLLPVEVSGQGITEEIITDYQANAGTLNYTVSANAMQFARRNEAYISFRKEDTTGTWIEQFSTRSFFYTVEKGIYDVPFKDSNYWFTFKELYRLFNQYISDGKTSWEEFVEQNREILESVDPGGVILRELIDTRTNADGQVFKSVADRVAADNANKCVADYLSQKYVASNDSIIYLHGFKSVGDSGGSLYSYEVKKIMNTETWIDSGKAFELTKDGEIKLSDTQKLIPIFDSEVLLGAFGVNGTSDDMLFQIALDFAIQNNIKLNINVNCGIEGVIDIKRSIDERIIIEIVGRGTIKKITPGFLFHNSTSRNGGNLRFTGIHFESEAGVKTTIFNAGYMIRMYFNQCNFYNVDCLFYAGGTDTQFNYGQTIYVQGCTIVGGEGWFANVDTGYDISFTGSIVEHREHFLRSLHSHSVRVLDCLIEGMGGQVFYGIDGRSLNIENNYFEACSTDNNYPYIQFMNQTLGINDFQSASIRNNTFIGSADQIASNSFYLINYIYLPQSVQFGGNYADCHFVKTNYEFSVSMNIEVLKQLYAENVTGNKYVINNRQKRDQIVLGSGNELSKYFKHPFDKELFTIFPADGSVLLDYYENKYRLRLYQNGTSSPAQMYMMTNKEYYASGVEYVIGVSIFPRTLGSGVGNVSVVLYNESFSVVYSHDIDIQNNSFITNKPIFYSLRPFSVASGNYYLAVVQRGNASSIVAQETAFSLDNLVLQRGTIATN